VIIIQLNLWPSQVVGHVPIDVARDESGAIRQAQSNTQTAGRATLTIMGNSIPIKHRNITKTTEQNSQDSDRRTVVHTQLYATH